MYLHVGNQKNIREKNIIGIFDMDNATVSPLTRQFLVKYQKENKIVPNGEEIPKSFVLYLDAGEDKILFSQLSSAALIGRTTSQNG